MKLRTMVVTMLIGISMVAAGAAQGPQPPQPAPPPTPAAPTAAAPRTVTSPPASLANIKIEVTLSQTGPTPMKRSVTMMVADGGRGALRSAGGAVVNNVPPQLNVDVRPRIERNGAIRTSFVIEFNRNTSFSFEPLLDSGKPVVAFEAPDSPDGTTTVTVTATVLR